MYDLVINEYIPFEYPELKEYIPEPDQEYQGFQWNPVPDYFCPPDMSKGEYSINLARDAYQFGIMPLELNHD